MRCLHVDASGMAPNRAIYTGVFHCATIDAASTSHDCWLDSARMEAGTLFYAPGDFADWRLADGAKLHSPTARLKRYALIYSATLASMASFSESGRLRCHIASFLRLPERSSPLYSIRHGVISPGAGPSRSGRPRRVASSRWRAFALPPTRRRLARMPV